MKALTTCTLPLAFPFASFRFCYVYYHLFLDARLTLAVEDRLQRHRAHPFGQEDNEVLRPKARSDVRRVGLENSWPRRASCRDAWCSLLGVERHECT